LVIEAGSVNFKTIKTSSFVSLTSQINPLNAELNLICHLLALLGAHPILHLSRVRVKYSVTPLNGIDWDNEPSGYVENPDNWIFL